MKIVTLPGHTDIYGKKTGELRLDGVAVTVNRLVFASDLEKGLLKYVPQPNGFRVDIGGSFTFKVLDGDGEESPTYTVTLEQEPDIVLRLLPSGIITESSKPVKGDGRWHIDLDLEGRVYVEARLTGGARTTDTVIPRIVVDTDYEARENSDYTVEPRSQKLTIKAGYTEQLIRFDFTGIEDFLIEGDELIKIYPDWTDENHVNRPPTEWVEPVYLALRDNDRGAVHVTGPPGEVEEGEDAVFTVHLSRGTTVPIDVVWGTSPGGGASLLNDVVSLGGTVTFPPGSPDNATQTISVPVIDDLEPETAERFFVTLVRVEGKAASQVSIDRNRRKAGATIAENDGVTVSVSGDERVTLRATRPAYTISLDSAASKQAITVDYTTTDQTAEAGTDYTAANGTVTIPAGQSSATVTVATTENTDDEANRYFTLQDVQCTGRRRAASHAEHHPIRQYDYRGRRRRSVLRSPRSGQGLLRGGRRGRDGQRDRHTGGGHAAL